MANLDRTQLLRQFTEEEPENPFNWYALALEYKESEAGLAKSLFNKLLTEHAEYLPTYFTAAHFFAELEEIELADQIFQKGIALAKSQNELKTLQELQNAYQNFLFENDMD
ncbi:tetratricopeptide repeat protein [Algoriphagus halophytocola]|uniref:Tetratricopeptide repeat protein n=1 Tax=Algoriphagus halophytocola TaxID=2991499 RepID=A0ABY6MMP3_9BACT|nr:MULTISPECIES: tetratricopeptide repeat protein [unclassified Algoriphagus]UZD23591.1 tetratricopeptide repeat protein [Algoriphagus sp. TR-M5]WBL44884.1 tetratricopeptide repeat protein [Algoriphagus sp. TR-M9]